MKILQLTNKPPWPAKDGGAIAMLNLTKGLANEGNEMTVLAMNTHKHHTDPASVPEGIRQMADFRWVNVPATLSPLTALACLLFSDQPYTATRFISRDYETELVRILKEKNFDIVQLEGLYLCPYIPVIRKHSRARIAYRAHNIENEIWSRSAAISRGIKKWYLLNLASRIRKFEVKWMNSYDLLVPITERDEKMLTEMGNRKVSHVSPTGIDPEEAYNPAESIEFPSVLHIGSLDWAPNQEGLLWFLRECWPELSAEFPHLRFYIAGRNAPGWLVSLLSMPGVVFLGEVDNAYRLMASKAVMIVPLLSGSGMRIKIIEGMALGKSIVTTTTGAEGIPVSHPANILIADTAPEFIRNVGMLLRDRQLVEETGACARQFIFENFDNRTIVRRLAQFYENNLP